MSIDVGWTIWDLASGGVDNSTRNSFERRILAVWDAGVAAGRDDVADMAQREREWLYSGAYTPEAARERVETLEWAAAAMLAASDATTTTTTTSKPPTRKTPTTTSKPPAVTTTLPAPTPAVKSASSSPLLWGGLVLVAAVGVYYATRGR